MARVELREMAMVVVPAAISAVAVAATVGMARLSPAAQLQRSTLQWWAEMAGRQVLSLAPVAHRVALAPVASGLIDDWRRKPLERHRRLRFRLEPGLPILQSH